MTNIRTVRIFTSEEREHQRYMNAASKSSEMATSHGKLVGILQGLTSLAVSAIALVVLTYGGQLVITNQMTYGLAFIN
jgi:ABC-type bacteriocin/lantibiotic exporter with double-glycine peptidase domain